MRLSKVATNFDLLLLVVKCARKWEFISTDFIIDLRSRVLNHSNADFLNVIGNARHLIASIAPNRYMYNRKVFR